MREYPTRVDGDYSSEAVANFFLDLAKKAETTLTNIKLQKLIYFASGFYLALHRRPLVNEEFSAWSYGPVLPDLYHKLRGYKNKPITEDIPARDIVPGNSEAADILKNVWDDFGGKSVTHLVKSSHKKNSPWETVWDCGSGYLQPIPNRLVQEYFTGLLKN